MFHRRGPHPLSRRHQHPSRYRRSRAIRQLDRGAGAVDSQALNNPVRPVRVIDVFVSARGDIAATRTFFTKCYRGALRPARLLLIERLRWRW